ERRCLRSRDGLRPFDRGLGRRRYDRRQFLRSLRPDGRRGSGGGIRGHLGLVPISVIGVAGGSGTGDFSPDDEPLGGHRRGRRLWLALVDDLQDRGVGLVIFERAGVALNVVAQGNELVDDLLVVELNALSFELPRNLMYALLRHTPGPSALTVEQYLTRKSNFQARQ